MVVSLFPAMPAFAADGQIITVTSSGRRYQVISEANRTAALIDMAEGTTEYTNSGAGWTVTSAGVVYDVIEIRLDANSVSAKTIKKFTLQGSSSTPGRIAKLDLSGCTALEELYCSYNPLTELDLSKNKELRSCVVQNTPLTKLNVSGCTALEKLNCNYNQLTELVLSDNKAFKELYCYSNALTKLNVSGCTALTQLECNSNQLTKIDVSTNTALKVLTCGSNRLTELDVSANKALDRIYCSYNSSLAKLNVSGCTVLRQLDCYKTALTKLDVSKNTALENLDCRESLLTELDVSKNTALEDVVCAQNLLTKLDVSKNTALRYLYCYSNKLTELDVSKNAALVTLNCSDNKLTKMDVSKNTAIGTLYIEKNKLTELDISNLTKLSNLSCGDNLLTSLDLMKITKLSTLKCAGNKLTELRIPESAAISIIDVSRNGLLDVVGLGTVKKYILEDQEAMTAKDNIVNIPMISKGAGAGYESARQYELNAGSTITFMPTVGIKYDPATKRITADSLSNSAVFVTKNDKYVEGTVSVSGTITFSLAPNWVNPFTDVKESDWFYPHVAYVNQIGLFAGTSATTFGPQMSMTRGMVVTVLGKLKGIDPAGYPGASFDDVSTSMYYAPYVKWGVGIGILSGVGNNKFMPNADISRQDMAVILNNYAGKMGITLPQTKPAAAFTDAADIAGYAVDAINRMARAGVISGTGSFNPKDKATRADVAAMLHLFNEATK